MREYKGNSLSELVDDYVLVDIETTGLSPQKDDIIEIGAVKVKDNKIVDEFQTLIKTDRKLSNTIVNLTGITNEMLDKGEEISKVMEDFLEFAGDNVLVAHNANFDINFLYDKSEKHLNKYLKNDFIDTMKMSRRLLPGLDNYKLGTIAKHYNIDYSKAHRGLEDVKITYEVYSNLNNKA